MPQVTTKDGVSIEINLYGELNDGEHSIIGKTFKGKTVNKDVEVGVVRQIDNCRIRGVMGVWLILEDGRYIDASEAYQVCDYCHSPMDWYKKQVNSWLEPTDYIDEYRCVLCGREGEQAAGNTKEDIEVPF